MATDTGIADANKRFAQRSAERAARRAAEKPKPFRKCPNAATCGVDRTTAERCYVCGAKTIA